MRTVYKFPISVQTTGYQELKVNLPCAHTILKVTMQGDTPVLHVQLETDAGGKEYTFCLVWTGKEILTQYRVEFVDTFTTDNGLVYHMFKLLK